MFSCSLFLFSHQNWTFSLVIRQKSSSWTREPTLGESRGVCFNRPTSTTHRHPPGLPLQWRDLHCCFWRTSSAAFGGVRPSGGLLVVSTPSALQSSPIFWILPDFTALSHTHRAGAFETWTDWCSERLQETYRVSIKHEAGPERQKQDLNDWQSKPLRESRWSRSQAQT